MTTLTLGTACSIALPAPDGSTATHYGQVWARWGKRVQVRLDEPTLLCDPMTARWQLGEYVTLSADEVVPA